MAIFLSDSKTANVDLFYDLCFCTMAMCSDFFDMTIGDRFYTSQLIK